MGQPVQVKPAHLKKIRGKRRELKHLSTCRKRKKRSMSLVVASEEDTAQTGGVAALSEL